MTEPCPERVAELAPFWQATSLHEVGHALIGVLLGIEVDHVQLSYQRTGLGRWEVVGWTALGPNGHGTELHEQDALRYALAGLEAEALWLATAQHMHLGRARATVQGRNPDDVAAIRACTPYAGITLDAAVTWVHDTLLDQWQTATFLAEALREQRFLPGAAVAALV